MAETKYDLQQAFKRAFGIVPYAPLSTIHKNQKAEDYSTLNSAEQEAVKTSMLGTPIFLPCKLDNTELPSEPLIEISGSKNIIKTAIDGIDGEFKELFNLNDYTIVIRGVAVNESEDRLPESQISAIRALCEKKKEIKVSNDLTGLFGIDLLVIESFSFPGVEGAQNMQAYQLNCLSDKIYDIELKNG